MGTNSSLVTRAAGIVAAWAVDIVTAWVTGIGAEWAAIVLVLAAVGNVVVSFQCSALQHGRAQSLQGNFLFPFTNYTIYNI